MEIYRTEEEQLEVLKSWLQRNGRAMAIGISVALIIVLGYQLWKSNRQSYNQSASLAYQDVIEAAQKAATAPTKPGVKSSASLEAMTVNTLGEKLIQDYPRSVYAQLTALLLAKQDLHDGQVKKSIDHLQWVLDRDPEDNLRYLVQLRLARVLFSANRSAEAQALLAIKKDNAYFPLYKELSGDILAAQGKIAEAKKSYQAALDVLAKQKENAPFLKMKLDNL